MPLRPREREREILGAVSVRADFVGNVDTAFGRKGRGVVEVDTGDCASSRLHALASLLAVRGGIGCVEEGLNAVAALCGHSSTVPQVAQARCQVSYHHTT